MAWAPDYADADDLKAHLRVSDTADDTALGIAITAASRAIDRACNRQFGLTGSAAARTYTYDGGRLDGRAALAVDDLQTTTGLVVLADRDENGTFEQTLTLSTDFDLWPWNAAADGKPWTHIVLRPTTGAYFRTGARAAQITANWGWSTVPTMVVQAALIQAARFFVRRDSSFGIAGSPDVGSEMRLLDRLDPDVAMMLGTLWRPWPPA